MLANAIDRCVLPLRSRAAVPKGFISYDPFSDHLGTVLGCTEKQSGSCPSSLKQLRNADVPSNCQGPSEGLDRWDEDSLHARGMMFNLFPFWAMDVSGHRIQYRMTKC